MSHSLPVVSPLRYAAVLRLQIVGTGWNQIEEVAIATDLTSTEVHALAKLPGTEAMKEAIRIHQRNQEPNK